MSMAEVLVVAGDGLRAMLHRRSLLAIIVVAVILTVGFYVVVGHIAQELTPSDPSVAESESGADLLAAVQDRAVRSQIKQLVAIFFELVLLGGVAISILAGAFAMSSEHSGGSFALILTRPVKRWQLLVGKYLGVVALLLGYTALIGGALAVYTIAHDLEIPETLAVPWLAFCLFLMLSSLSFVLATVMHYAFAALLSFYSYLIWTFQVLVVDTAFYNVYVALPSFGLYGVRSQIVGNTLEYGWDVVSVLTLYALDVTLIFLLLALWRFHSKKVK